MFKEKLFLPPFKKREVKKGMGVPRFFFWLTKNIPGIVKQKLPLRKNNGVKKYIKNGGVDNFCIDCNGLFHPVFQRVKEENKGKSIKERNEVAFEEIFKEIKKLVSIVSPNKRVVLCVDGVAPQSKMVQQRQRRFKSSGNNCITPGTPWMYRLNTFLEKKIGEEVKEGGEWKGLTIIFSSERVAGEGEHKIMKVIREGSAKESWMIHGLDADLIMLSLATHKPRIYILRETVVDKEYSTYDIVDIFCLRVNLIQMLYSSKNMDEIRKLCMNEKYTFLIDDFVFFCFLMGNDFVPHSPSLDILEGGIETVISLYRSHVLNMRGGPLLTKDSKSNIVIHRQSLSSFLYKLGELEEEAILKKGMNRKYFKNVLLNKHIDKRRKRFRNYRNYKWEYYREKFNGDPEEKVIRNYIEGLEWIIRYYTRGIPSWEWYFPYFYSPFLSDIPRYLSRWRPISYRPTSPAEPFQQLLMVFPKQSIQLFLPKSLHSVPDILAPKFPEKFRIDLEGKLRDWEGIAVIPFITKKDIEKEYEKIPKKTRMLKRNVILDEPLVF